jgi:hypothetical protein
MVGFATHYKSYIAVAAVAVCYCCRAVSHLGFASIKAAICSSTDSAAASTAAHASPTTVVSATVRGTPCIPPLVPAATACSNSSSLTGSNADVATAVAAALSPRATQAQTQALAGVFGGGCFVGADGSAVGVGRPSCARRMPWGSHEEGTPVHSKVGGWILASQSQVHICRLQLHLQVA